MARIQPGGSPGARLVEPKARQRASASPRGGVRRKLKAKSQGDEQESDMRRDAFGTSGHVTAKSSIYKWVATPTRVHFVNPAFMRGRIRVLPREICYVSWPCKRQETESWGTGFELMTEVSRRHSRCDPHRRPEP